VRYILQDGQLSAPHLATGLLENRAFRLGDGLFETVRVAGGRVLFWPHHWARLQRGMHLLRMEPPSPSFTQQTILKSLYALIDANQIHQGGKIRLQVYRTGSEGAYLPTRNSTGWVCEATLLLHNAYPTERSIRAVPYKGHTVMPHAYSGLKTSSALPYVLALQHAETCKCDDALLTDTEGNYVETARANLFCIADGALITPALTSGCLDGVLRKTLLALAHEKGINVQESVLSPALLAHAEAVFTTNVISGILPVHYIAALNLNYTPATASLLLALQALLNRHATSYPGRVEQLA